MEGSLIPGSNLALSKEDRDRLGRLLVSLCEDLEAQHSPYIKNIDKLWKFYWAEPQHETRNTPWQNASNVVYPLIQLHSDAIKARMKNTLFATHPDLVLGRSRNEAARGLSQKRADFYNWAADDHEFDLLTPVGEWIDEAIPIGGSILFQKWVERYRHVFVPGAGGKATLQKIHLGTGPVYERVPREQVIWQLDRPIGDAEVVIRQSLKSTADLALMKQLGQVTLDDEEFAEVLRHTSDGGYTKSIQTARLARDGLTTGREREDLYDIREAWIEVPLLKSNKLVDSATDPDAPILPVVVTFERNSGLILRAISKPYLTRGVPAYELSFRTAGSRRNPSGVAKRLEHLQRAITTMYNQAIDAVTLANSVNGITNDSRLLNSRFSPGKFLYSDDPANAFAPIQLSKLITPDIALIQMALATAERATGIADPLFGRETRHGGHPSPAASTAMLLQESREMFRDTIRQMRFSFNRAVHDTMALYQQFGFPGEDRLVAALGDEDASEILGSLRPDFPYWSETFDLKIASETMNQDQELQTAMVLLQGQMAYGSQVVNLIGMVEKAGQQAPLTAQAAMKLVETLSLSWARVLEAGREDEIKRFLIDFRESQGSPKVAQEFGAYAQGLLRDVSQAQGERVLPPAPEATGIPAMAGGANGAAFPGI